MYASEYSAKFTNSLDPTTSQVVFIKIKVHEMDEMNRDCPSKRSCQYVRFNRDSTEHFPAIERSLLPCVASICILSG